LPSVVKNGQDLDIAHISFAYNNSKLLELLLERGSLITKGKITKPLEKVNKKIDELMTNHGDKMERPVAAFVTFNTQEGI